MRQLLTTILNTNNKPTKNNKTKLILSKMSDDQLIEYIKLFSPNESNEIGLIIDEVVSRNSKNQFLLDFKERIFNCFN